MIATKAPAEKMVTEREMVLACRRAYEDGARELFIQEEIPGGDVTHDAMKRVIAGAADALPLPKVERARLVEWHDSKSRHHAPVQFRVSSNRIEYRVASGLNRWQDLSDSTWDADATLFAALADLTARPNELVDE